MQSCASICRTASPSLLQLLQKLELQLRSSEFKWLPAASWSYCSTVRIVRLRRTRAILTVLTVPYRNTPYCTELIRWSWLVRSQTVQDGCHRTVRFWCKLVVWLQCRPKTFVFFLQQLFKNKTLIVNQESSTASNFEFPCKPLLGPSSELMQPQPSLRVVQGSIVWRQHMRGACRRREWEVLGRRGHSEAKVSLAVPALELMQPQPSLRVVHGSIVRRQHMGGAHRRAKMGGFGAESSFWGHFCTGSASMVPYCTPQCILLSRRKNTVAEIRMYAVLNKKDGLYRTHSTVWPSEHKPVYYAFLSPGRACTPFKGFVLGSAHCVSSDRDSACKQLHCSAPTKARVAVLSQLALFFRTAGLNTRT